MIKNIGAGRIPRWLARGPALPLNSILRDSAFYPGSWLDFDPIFQVGSRFPSFVYADYSVPKEAISDALRQLHGYQVMLMREVSMEELDLSPDINQEFVGYVTSEVVPPYAIWAILEARPDANLGEVGPTRFSLLFVGAEAVAVYQGLYIKNKRAPSVIALIQVGVEWTDFSDPAQAMAMAVLGNPAGQPEYLLGGGIGPAEYYLQPCWPIYSESVWSGTRSFDGSLHLWRRP